MLLEDLYVVLKVAEFRSITGAAANLDMRTSTASAALKRVERSLGVELFLRTTRQLRVSAAGERFLPQCEQAILLLENARQNIREDQSTIDGEMRIALSSDLGRNHVAVWLDEFMDHWPQLSLKVNINDSNVDFYRDPVDMALRYGSPDDANLYGFKICQVPRVLCASPDYLKQHGTPKHPEDLSSHNGLFYQLYDIIYDVWEFTHNNQPLKVKVKGNRASNDADLVRRWCVAGKGLAVKSCLDMSADLLSGKITTVMKNYKPVPTELWLVFPSRQSITPAARLLRDELKQRCHIILTQLADNEVIENSEFDL